MSLSAGDRLGSYEILAPLGAGGMGEVYRATDTKLGRDVIHRNVNTGAVPQARPCGGSWRVLPPVFGGAGSPGS